MNPTSFEELETTLECGGVEPALALLAERFRDEGKYHELFDTRLMQARHLLGLPIVSSQPLDDHPEPQRTQLESAYLEACREVGHLLLAQGNLREAWVYLRPTGENATVAEVIQKIEPNDDNLNDLIGLALHEGVAPAYGYSLVLSHYGTCNAITTFNAEMGRFARADQQAAATALVRRLHSDLVENVRAHIAQQEGREPAAESSLDQLVAGREWLFEGGNYHTDTTHLSSTVQIARILEERDTVRLAWELTEYGRRLNAQYQFPGEEPFAELYLSHGLFYGAQVGNNVEEAIAYFRNKAEQLTVEEEGPFPREVYVVLLSRLGRFQEAMQESARLLPATVRTSGFAPSLLELARQAGDYSLVRQLSRERGDLLTYAVGLISER